MKIKKYTVESMKDAMAKIRDDLGPEAVILHSKKIPQLGDGKALFEITAAVEESEMSKPAVKPEKTIRSGQNLSMNKSIIGGKPDSLSRRNIDFIIADEDSDGEEMVSPHKKKKSLNVIHGTRNPEAVPEISIRLSEVHQAMLDNDVDDLVAEGLVKTAMEQTRIAKGQSVETVLPRSLSRYVNCSGPIEKSPTGKKVVALVGPTGVGKTTTIAKLASHLSVIEGLSVALITVDIKRTSAVQQLKTYADVLGTPFEVALNPAELRKAIEKHSDCDIILIDTSGKSPYRWLSILELSAFLKNINDVEIHLVLSAATREKENLAAVERFGALAISHLIFTKIDETGDCGEILNVAVISGKPVSYITEGQNIPDDIEVATYNRMMELVTKPKPGNKKQ